MFIGFEINGMKTLTTLTSDNLKADINGVKI